MPNIIIIYIRHLPPKPIVNISKQHKQSFKLAERLYIYTINNLYVNMPLLRSAVDPSKSKTPLELCSFENPPRDVPKPTRSKTLEDEEWPQVEIENVTELESFTYYTVMNAFKHLLTLRIPYSPDVIKHMRNRARQALGTKRKAEKHFMLYCENCLIPMLDLIISSLGPTYHIDFDIVKPAPEFEGWPSVLEPTKREADFGCVYKLMASNGVEDCEMILVADAKVTNWTWSDRHRRRVGKALKKFTWPCRQVAAYGVLSKTQYTAIITPEEACLCRLVDHGKLKSSTGKGEMSFKSIGIQGKSIDWAVSGPGVLTAMMSLAVWILMAMNEHYRSITPLGSQIRLSEWNVMHYDGKIVYRNRISRITTVEKPLGNIILREIDREN